MRLGTPSENDIPVAAVAVAAAVVAAAMVAFGTVEVALLMIVHTDYSTDKGCHVPYLRCKVSHSRNTLWGPDEKDLVHRLSARWEMLKLGAVPSTDLGHGRGCHRSRCGSA